MSGVDSDEHDGDENAKALTFHSENTATGYESELGERCQVCP